jgi:hypothetical protein
MWKLLLTWSLCIGSGLFLTWVASRGITEALTPHEVKNWEAGRPIFDRPVTEAYAKSIQHEILAEKDRRDIMSRTDPGIAAAITNLGLWLLSDPIKIILLIVFTILSRKGLRMIAVQVEQETHQER